MGLDRWAREVELREKEVELMQKLQLSFSEQVQIDLEALRSEMRAHGISTENRLKHLPLSLSRRPAEEPQSPATTGLIDQTTANSTTSAVRRQSTGAAANRTGSKAATLAAASSYFARKGEATVDPVAAPAPRSNRAADRADLLFSTLDRRNGDGVITKQEMVEGLRNSGSVANGGVASLSDNRAKLRQLREQREAFEAKTNIR